MFRSFLSTSTHRSQPNIFKCSALLKASKRSTASCHNSCPSTQMRQAPTQNRPSVTAFWLLSSSQLPRTLSLQYYARRQYTTQRSFPDPDRPDLFYHLFDPPTPLSDNLPVFALSFLPTMPTSVDSCAIVGWLPAASPGQAESAGLNDFLPNEKFVGALHEAVHSALRDGVDEIQRNAAIQTQQGWMHIHDARNVPALGRIGDPDDIIASVRVEDGQILADTYQPMPSYRLCTADGVLQLTEGLARRLMEVLEQRTKAEAASMSE